MAPPSPVAAGAASRSPMPNGERAGGGRRGERRRGRAGRRGGDEGYGAERRGRGVCRHAAQRRRRRGRRDRRSRTCDDRPAGELGAVSRRRRSGSRRRPPTGSAGWPASRAFGREIVVAQPLGAPASFTASLARRQGEGDEEGRIEDLERQRLGRRGGALQGQQVARASPPRPHRSSRGSRGASKACFRAVRLEHREIVELDEGLGVLLRRGPSSRPA